jgi:ubiquinone/menaquinone biosynthesis C-methylase UbiE
MGNEKRRQIATEYETFDMALDRIELKKKWSAAIFTRLMHVSILPDKPKILDVGAASGQFLVGCYQLGYEAIGIEPCEEARSNAIKLSEYFNIPINVVNGSAESIPFEDNTFDVIHACSVIEHVGDLEKTIKEISRVLKAGGVFWFSTTSSLCPMQGEIRGFPLFGWYPNSLKLRIMNWAKENRPHLIGYTQTPAIHWFTPSRVHKLMNEYGFSRIYDRWDLRQGDEGGKLYGLILKVIKSKKYFKMLADVMIPGCSYAVIKDGK